VGQKTVKRIVAAVLTAAALLTTSVGVFAEYTDATVKSYEEQIIAATRNLEAAQASLSDIRDRRASAWEEIARIDEIINTQLELKELTEKYLESLEEQIEQTKINIATLEEKIAIQEEARLNRMAQNYMSESVDFIELIFGSKSLVDFLSKLERIRSVMEYDNRIIAELGENREQLQIEQLKLNEALAIQKEKVADYTRIIKEYQAMSEEKLALINSLNNDETEAMNVYYYYKALDEQLNRELEEYLAELQRKNQSAYVGGNGGWPLEPGAYYHISSEQGWRKLNGVDDYHLGIDIACYNGTPIRAFNAGTVIVSTKHSSYGNYVMIDHGGGIVTLYAHMSSNEVKVGDYVQAGQLVGYCGLTGNTYGYHLHFEVRENGKVVNPRNYLVFP